MSNKILVFKRYLLWLVVLAIMVFIFVHSAQNGDESSKTSGSFIKTLLTVFVPDFSSLALDVQAELITGMQFIVRKGAHFSIYLLLGFFSFLAMNTYNLLLRTKSVSALSISLIYAISDEIHQLFVPGRAGQLRDVVIDFSGAFCGVVFAGLLVYLFSKLSKGKEGLSYEEKGLN